MFAVVTLTGAMALRTVLLVSEMLVGCGLDG